MTTNSTHPVPDGYTEIRMPTATGRAFLSDDGYLILEGDDWEYDNPDEPDTPTCEVWFAYAPNDPGHTFALGFADWPSLDCALNAIDRHRTARRNDAYWRTHTHPTLFPDT